jgi:hypothetical protein
MGRPAGSAACARERGKTIHARRDVHPALAIDGSRAETAELVPEPAFRGQTVQWLREVVWNALTVWPPIDGGRARGGKSP